MKYNPLIHHRRSIRLKGYDYSQAGAYFITICTKNRQHLFGQVVNGKMILNEMGQIAYNEWLKTPKLRPNVSLDVFVIMPNHMHGIIVINDKDGKGESHSPDILDMDNIDDRGVCDTPPPEPDKDESNSPQILDIDNKGECNSPRRDKIEFKSPSNNMGAIVRGYKSSVTKQIKLLNHDPSVWQRNYHEHIIRNEQSYHRISNYIINNPAKWNEDKFFI